MFYLVLLSQVYAVNLKTHSPITSRDVYGTLKNPWDYRHLVSVSLKGRGFICYSLDSRYIVLCIALDLVRHLMYQKVCLVLR